MRKKTYSSSSSSSSDDEVLISLKKEKDSNGYQSLCDPSYQCCEFCDDVFTNRYDLIKHNITHMIIPLKKLTEQCKICFQHFAPGDELESHMLTHNNLQNNINKITPDILKSIVEKQVLVKCELDINALMTLSQNNVITTNKITNGHTESQIVKSKTKKSDVALQIKSELTCQRSDLACQKSDLTCQQNDMEIFNVDDIENVVKKEKDLVKEEPLSPPLKERASSPFDEDKESIRQRLIFEEDVEDTLFKNLSSECNVNIDKLCQEVTFDFDDAIPVSDSDDSIGFNKDLYDVPDESDISEILMDNAVKTENHVIKMNNSDILMDNAIKTVNNVVKMNNSDIGMNNILKQIKSEEVSNVDLKSGIDKTNYSDVNFANAINGFQNGIDGTKQEEFSKRLVILDVVEKVDFKPSTHYDDLMFPDISICQYCKKEFPNRYQLIQHEAIHIRTKKKRCRSSLCCRCDKYIVGNHYNMKSHIAESHPKYINRNIVHTTLRCEKCGLRYFNNKKHIRNYHEPYRCEKCSVGFETLAKKDSHICEKPTVEKSEHFIEPKISVLKLCDLCFSFINMYMQSRYNYEQVGTKSEIGVRQTCDKCNNKFFSVQLVKRKPKPLFGPLSKLIENRKVYVKKKLTTTASSSSKSKTKSLSNQERLLKISKRLKMLKMMS